MLKTPQSKLFPFTDFNSVTPQTKLKDLNLNWRERDLPERYRTKHVHRLHPYLGKFVPQLVEIFLRKYQPKMVVDPFCGSGTTLVEAQTLGIDSFGCDISQFNCLLSKVKTEKYDLRLLEQEVHEVLERSSEIPQGILMDKATRYSSTSYLAQWFAPQALGELLRFRDAIGECHYKDVLHIILSRAARSARLTTHFDLDFPKKPQTKPYQCYKHSRECQPTSNARQFLKRYSLDTLRRIREFSEIQSDSSVDIACGDSRFIEFPECDLVMTSPPYVGLIDYHEQHKYAYELLGLDWKAENEIGAAHKGNSRSAQNEYLDQMERVFLNIKQYLKKKANLVVVVHDRKNLYHELSKRLGFRTVAEIHRHVNRRTGRRAGDFFESVFVWRAT